MKKNKTYPKIRASEASVISFQMLHNSDYNKHGFANIVFEVVAG